MLLPHFRNTKYDNIHHSPFMTWVWPSFPSHEVHLLLTFLCGLLHLALFCGIGSEMSGSFCICVIQANLYPNWKLTIFKIINHCRLSRLKPWLATLHVHFSDLIQNNCYKKNVQFQEKKVCLASNLWSLENISLKALVKFKTFKRSFQKKGLLECLTRHFKIYF